MKLKHLTQTFKKHTLNKIILLFSGVFFIWCIWQHEIMMFPYMAERWDTWFQFFTGIRIHWGTAYDITLLGEFIAYILLGITLWFWEED
jgi:hypothetical protein